MIKILCTTVGETAADYLNANLGLGLTNTTYLISALLIVALVFQFRARKYVPGIYWLAVVLISVVGTLITDNLVDNFGVALETTTIAFSIALAATFAAWYRSERTLSIHTIVTTRRESFYWLAILFTFALGTAAGDLAAERIGLGFGPSVLIFAGLIAVVALAHFRFKLNAVLAFWLAYILTRPLGASIGDYMSQPTKDGGLGLGTTVTSIIFLGTILALVIFLTVTRRDVIEVDAADTARPILGRGRRPHRRQQDGRNPGADRRGARARGRRSGAVRAARAEPATISPSTASARTSRTASRCSRWRCRCWRKRPVGRSRAAWPTARTRTTSSPPRSRRTSTTT